MSDLIGRALKAQLRFLAVGAGGLLSITVGTPLILVVSAIGVAAVIEVLRMEKAKRRDARVRELVFTGEKSRKDLLDLLHDDELRVYAFFMEKGKYAYALIGHCDPAEDKRLDKIGALVSVEAIRRRADEGYIQFLAT